MNVIYKQVRHQQYGVGIVTSQTTTTVTLEFNEKYGTKKFLYPTAFESFLELCDPAAQAEMSDELHQIEERAEQERQKREEEDEKRREVEHHTLLEQKRAATKKKTAVKKAPAKPKRHIEEAEPTEDYADM